MAPGRRRDNVDSLGPPDAGRLGCQRQRSVASLLKGHVETGVFVPGDDLPDAGFAGISVESRCVALVAPVLLQLVENDTVAGVVESAQPVRPLIHHLTGARPIKESPAGGVALVK